MKLNDLEREANEYFEHNPHCKSVLFYMIPIENFVIDDDNSGLHGLQGELNFTLYLDECFAQIDNDDYKEEPISSIVKKHFIENKLNDNDESEV